MKEQKQEITYKVSLAQSADVKRILEIYAAARSFMRSYGNSEQWGDSYPDEQFVCDAIASGEMYAVKNGNDIAAVFTASDKDGDYEKLNLWRGSCAYLAVHAVATSQNYRGKGAAKFIFAYCENLARKTGKNSIRMDTHERNAPMRALFSSQSFIERGKAQLSFGSRLVFEKLL